MYKLSATLLDYGSAGTPTDLLSRVASLKISTETTPFVTYDYLGVGSVVQTKYPQPNVTKNLFQTGSTGDAGDIYASLDRFGRLEEVRWDNATTTLERVLYGYDRVGNRTWRDVLTPDSSGTTPLTGLDEKYAYDGLYQVTQRQRGDLNTARTAISGTPVREEQFGYDTAGNWLAYTSKASGATTLDQRRGHNDLNQIGSLSTALGATWDPDTNPLTSDKVEHDANGNMILLPHGSDGDWGKAMKLTWDAWNRLVKVQKASDGTVIASYQYDGLWRRTVKVITGETRHYYYNDQWRSVEEHIEKADTTKVVEQQHLWGPHHRWEYIRRDRNTTPLTTSILNETLYGLSDAMSLTAIVDTAGAIKERYQYSAFGQRLCVSADWVGLSESAFAWMLGFHMEFSDAGGGGKVDTGLTNYGFRYYDPLCGRWLGRDPIWEGGGVNLYAMVGNQITIKLDNRGRHPVEGGGLGESAKQARSRLKNEGEIKYSKPVIWTPTGKQRCKGVDVETFFIQVVTKSDGTRFTDDNTHGFGKELAAVQKFFGANSEYEQPNPTVYPGIDNYFADEPTPNVDFEVCVSCICKRTKKVISIGPCKKWKTSNKYDPPHKTIFKTKGGSTTTYYNEVDLGNEQNFPTTEKPSQEFIDTIWKEHHEDLDLVRLSPLPSILTPMINENYFDLRGIGGKGGY